MAGIAEYVRCDICGEPIAINEDDVFIGMGVIAEMHDPDNPEEHGGIVHAECGLAKGWVIS